MAVSTSLVWTKDSIDAQIGGRLLEEWLLDVNLTNKNILFICGAGISIPGTTITPTGSMLARAFYRYLTLRHINIPPSWQDSIYKLYQYYCYDFGGPYPSFDQNKHNEFVSAMLDINTAGFAFLGQPNDSHYALEREVAASNRWIFSGTRKNSGRLNWPAIRCASGLARRLCFGRDLSRHLRKAGRIGERIRSHILEEHPSARSGCWQIRGQQPDGREFPPFLLGNIVYYSQISPILFNL